MAFILPTANNAHQLSPASNTRYLASINSPSTLGAKSQGNLPITDTAGQWNNSVAGNTVGIGYEFQASQAGYDVTTDTLIVLWHNQFNAPNRIQVDTVGNGGTIVRIYSGTGTMPTVYRDFYVGGNDTPNAECCKGQYPFTIDLNDATHDASNGTWDATDITSYAFLTTRLDMAGTSTNWNYMGSMYVLATTKASSNTPTFSSASSTIQDAATLLQGTDYTNKIGSWVRQVGTTVFIDMPFRVGNNSTITTFDDEGYTVVSPAANDSSDPRVRVTTQAFRTYLNLRNNVADTATFSGTWIWQVRSPFDWDQDDAAVVTFEGATFKGMGAFTLGSSITGSATWDDVDEVIFADTGVDVDGSTFKNPNGTHSLNLTAGAMDIATMRFESYTSNHAILIDTAGTYNFDNVFFDQSGTNDIETTHATGTVTINISNGGTVPTVTETGAGAVVINNSVDLTITANDDSGSPIEDARVLLEADTGGALPVDESVTITRSGATATVTHTAHGIPDGSFVVIRNAGEEDYNGVFTATVTGVNSYTYTVPGTPATPATGTIIASSVLIYELTNASGIATETYNYSADQPIKGVVRKASSAPYYRQGVISGTIVSAGYSATILLISDE